MEDTYLTGTLAGAGSFRCDECSYAVGLDSLEAVPECPKCGASSFSRASLFDIHSPERGGDIQGGDNGEWVAAVRDELEQPGHYLACHEAGRVSVTPLAGQWTKIGRGLSTDIRLDDPTVSRRHALVAQEGSDVRVLDDRSLNGVFLNGERVDSSLLRDGDELIVGRYRLYFLDTTAMAAQSQQGNANATPA